MTVFRDVGNDRMTVEKTSYPAYQNAVRIELGRVTIFDPDTAREIAREILRLTGDGASNEQAPPQNKQCYPVAFLSQSGVMLSKVTGAYRCANGDIVYTSEKTSEPHTLQQFVEFGWNPLYSVESEQ